MDTMERDALIERLARMPSLLADAVAGLPAARWTCKPAPGSFSPVEHACHLRDLEAEGYQVRIRRLIEEDLPTLDEVDGSAWATERGYQAQSLREALADFTRHRQATLGLLADGLPRHAGRKGLFGGFGIVTLAGLAREIAAHDAGHLQELQALRLAG
ncbi:MAG: DinB family protein [Pseudomonadota bacterium]